MPDEEDFVLSDSEHVMDELQRGAAEVPTGDSGILDAQVADPNLLTITRDGPCTIIGFRHKSFPDEMSIAAYRDQVYRLLEDPECKVIKFDVAGVKLFPSGMLGLLVSVRNRGCEVEVINAAPEVLETLKITKLDTLLTVRRGS